MFKRFQKKPQPQSEQVSPLPAPAPPPPVVPLPKQAEEMQFCACCQQEGARYVIRIGDFYLKSLLVYLCDTCMAARIEATCQQHFSQRKTPPVTSVRMEAIHVAKQKAMGA